jgi:hypothetical protein
MAATNPIDEYLAALDEPKRTTLTSLRDTIMAIFPRRGAVHLIRAARIQAAREDHRRVRGLQEPPQLPATQRVCDPPARKGDGGIHVHQRITALPCRRASPRGAGEEASGYADGRSFRQGVVLVPAADPYPSPYGHAGAW